jgi:hypothetical protein
MWYATSHEFLVDNPTLSRESALRLIHEYDSTTQEFDQAFGVHERYATESILEWLGF